MTRFPGGQNVTIKKQGDAQLAGVFLLDEHLAEALEAHARAHEIAYIEARRRPVALLEATLNLKEKIQAQFSSFLPEAGMTPCSLSMRAIRSDRLASHFS